MIGRPAQYRLFWQEFRRTFQSTGAILPSGRPLCKALARYAAQRPGPRRILEAGPGTGVVTDVLINRLEPGDTLDLVEVNDRFVAALRHRLTTDDAWRRRTDQVRIHHLPIEELTPREPYDAIVSGLPLNNFTPELASKLLQHLGGIAGAGATLSFFEYVGVRKAKALLASQAERRRLAGVEQALAEALSGREFARDFVLANVPPAWVHHLRFE
ncbi:MAG TPA: hypothetical protein PJ982_17420 [Lacipirellulaceae bacterium]|nr:hypothetical protein [Lacipirellulaceae bacterium]